MAIDTSGTWWTGSNAADLDEFLVAYSREGYLVSKVTHSVCGSCQAEVFTLLADEDEGCVQTNLRRVR